DFHVTGVQTCALPIFIVVPAHLIYRFIAPEVEDEFPAPLHFIEELLANVADHVAERIDENYAAPESVFFDDWLYQRPLYDRIHRVADFSECSSFCEVTRCFAEYVGEWEMKVFQVLDNIEFDRGRWRPVQYQRKNTIVGPNEKMVVVLHGQVARVTIKN